MKKMRIKFPAKFFITGTDTGIGKTLVSAILMTGLDADYWKPIQSGLEGITDLEWVMEKTGLAEKHFHPETYRAQRPLSPHASTALEGIRIDLNAFHVPEIGESRHLIIEGAGGIMVPLNERHYILDLIKYLHVPVLLVASSSLGTINHTLLSLKQLRRHEIDVFCVVMNGTQNHINREAIEYYGKVDVYGEIEPLEVINKQTLSMAFERYFTLPDHKKSSI